MHFWLLNCIRSEFYASTTHQTHESPGFRGGWLVKVNQPSLSSRQVAESSLPQPLPVEYTQ